MPTRLTDGAETVLRVLVIEDDAAYAGLVRAMLDSVGSVRFESDHAESLRAALARLSSAPFDVALLDLGLADAEGLRALSSLVAAVPDLPIVILTGAVDEVLAFQAVQAGAQDYLLKGSVTTDGLGRAIRYAIERKQSELYIKNLALRDSLTHLPNRRLLIEHLDGALTRARRGQHLVGVFFVDVDHFKQINDTAGHEAGDAVLQQLATRLRQSLRDSDTLARLGGDEFVAVVEVKQRPELALIAENIRHRLKAPFTTPSGELFITASIGISSYPADGVDVTELLRNADRAMYRVKAEGRASHRFYAPDLQTTAPAPLAFSGRLRQAVERQELLLHFQPLVDLRTDLIDGVEALVRWQHPSSGLIPPSEFIPIAEESDLILSIERWVLQSAMTEAAAYDGGRCLKLAVNLSTRHFGHPALLGELRNISQLVGYDPSLLELELTERGIMHHPKRVLRHLKGLRRLGIRVAVDDFGMGYSCLGLMKRFPLNALKIDPSFVRNCAADKANGALVAAIIRMGHAFGLEVTAEGVETATELAYLREQQCDRAQGLYFSRPIPGAELRALLTAQGH